MKNIKIGIPTLDKKTEKLILKELEKNIDDTYKEKLSFIEDTLLFSKYKKIFSIIYIIAPITFIGIVGLSLFLLFSKAIAGMVLTIVLGLPIIILLGIVTIVKFILDFNKIKKRLLLSLDKTFGINIFIARFYYPNSRTEDKIILTKKGSFEFVKGTYIIDPQAIYKGDLNLPISHYYYGIPNPIIFDFTKAIELSSPELTENGQNMPILNGKEIDIIYNSEALKKYKDDVFLELLHKEVTKGDNFNLTTVLLIVILVIVIIMVGFLIFSRGGQ